MLQINYWYENKIIDKDSYNIKDVFFDLENKKGNNMKFNDLKQFVFTISGLKNLLSLLLAEDFNQDGKVVKQLNFYSVGWICRT